MDVKALYPSMTWDEIVKAIKEMIINSNMVIEGVNWREVSIYIKLQES